MPGSTILVIDDDSTIRKIMEEYLEQVGFRVLSAADGLEGLDMIRQENYDLVVLDVHLPYVSGIGLIKIAREKTPGIPVICITGYGYHPEQIAEEEKADIVLAKPVPLDELAENIKKLLNNTN
ncbi:MAG: response regulator [Desulfurivibrionaceae bacterium]